jgi:YD repeat-containing protein
MTELGNRLSHAFTWSYNDPARTVTASTPTGKTTTTVATTRGLPASVTEPSTQATTFDTYDAEGRLTQKTDGVGTTTYMLPIFL